jgi:hypothetical protein
MKFSRVAPEMGESGVHREAAGTPVSQRFQGIRAAGHWIYTALHGERKVLALKAIR